MSETEILLQAQNHILEQKLQFAEDIRAERNELRDEVRALRAVHPPLYPLSIALTMHSHLDTLGVIAADLGALADRCSETLVEQIMRRPL